MATERFSLRAGLAAGSFLFLSPLGGCAAASQDDTSPQTDDAAAALSVSSDAYVTVARDPRDCIGPRCGGFWVRRVNACAREVYASKLDLAALGWTAELEAQVLTAPPADLVLRGHLGPADPIHGTRPLVVREAYRGMPGVRAADKDVVFAVTPRTPHVECITAPCPQWTAQPLNEGVSAVVTFDRVDVDAAAEPLVDTAWLTARVESHGALAAGSMVAGDTFPGGRERVLTSRQVFLRLPDVSGPCPMAPIAACDDGQVMTFTRSVDRCLVAAGCVARGICPAYRPACAAGYTLVSWASGANGCAAFACDPAF
jgi:hypothetical protein